MNLAALIEIRDLIQNDINQRGLGSDPSSNLLTSCPQDFLQSCQSLSMPGQVSLGIVTGFFIPHASPPLTPTPLPQGSRGEGSGETDGPLGALFLARALVPLGIRVVLATDGFCARALQAGLQACGLQQKVPVVVFPPPTEMAEWSADTFWKWFYQRTGPLTHLLALERVGPCHTLASHQSHGDQGTLRGSISEFLSHLPLVLTPSTFRFVDTYKEFVSQVPDEHQNRCHSMRGLDITDSMSPSHLLFEAAREFKPQVTTIGIGDGGNEIGMGKISWDVIRRNIPNGGLIACRVPTDYLIVCGISNWGAYGLATGIALARGKPLPKSLFDVKTEFRLLSVMVKEGPLVDGVTGRPTATVDGLSFDRYAEILSRLEKKVVLRSE